MKIVAWLLFWALILGGSLSGPMASDSRPIYLTNSLPILHGSGLSAPKSSVLRKSDPEQDWSMLIYANIQSHANDSGATSENLILDGEVHQLGLATAWNFASRWQIGANVVFIKNTEGSLDGTIRQWHDIFDLDQGDRDILLDDQFLYEYSSENPSEEQRLSASASSLGDTEVTLSYQLHQNNSLSIAAHLGVMLPTGDSKKVTGSDKTDVKLGIAIGSLGSRLSWHINAEVVSIGDRFLFGVPTQSNAWATSAGLHWRANKNWRWSMQFDGHGGVFDSDIEEISEPAWQLGLATQYKHWQLYFAEDLSVNHAADFSFGLNWISDY